MYCCYQNPCFILQHILLPSPIARFATFPFVSTRSHCPITPSPYSSPHPTPARRFPLRTSICTRTAPLFSISISMHHAHPEDQIYVSWITQNSRKPRNAASMLVRFIDTVMLWGMPCMLVSLWVRWIWGRNWRVRWANGRIKRGRKERRGMEGWSKWKNANDRLSPRSTCPIFICFCSSFVVLWMYALCRYVVIRDID